MNALAAKTSLYERAGGADAISRLVECFYRNMDTLPEAADIRTMHAADLGAVKQVLKNYLTEWSGGPKLYSPVKGHPRLRQRHLGFSIGQKERDAWLACMLPALKECVADEAARHEIETAFVKLADWMRNQPGNPHDSRQAP